MARVIRGSKINADRKNAVANIGSVHRRGRLKERPARFLVKQVKSKGTLVVDRSITINQIPLVGKCCTRIFCPKMRGPSQNKHQCKQSSLSLGFHGSFSAFRILGRRIGNATIEPPFRRLVRAVTMGPSDYTRGNKGGAPSFLLATGGNMGDADCEDITGILKRANDGHPGAMNDLWTAVHEELRVLARRHMEREFGRNLPGVTLQPTALVNEGYLRLIKQRAKYDNRGHFFAIATKILVRVLRDYERERRAAKRGGDCVRISFDPQAGEQFSSETPDNNGIPIEPLVDALDKLEALDQRKSEVVKLRVFWGLSIAETSQAIGVGHATIERDWEFSRAWLGRELARAAS